MILLRLLILLSTRKKGAKADILSDDCMDWLILCDSKDYSEGVSLALWSFYVRFFGERKARGV